MRFLFAVSLVLLLSCTTEAHQQQQQYGWARVPGTYQCVPKTYCTPLRNALFGTCRSVFVPSLQPTPIPQQAPQLIPVPAIPAPPPPPQPQWIPGRWIWPQGGLPQ